MSDSPIELLKQLVAINSVNPDLVPGGAGEAAIGDFCAAWFSERGFEVHRIETRSGRPSIVGIARGVRRRQIADVQWPHRYRLHRHL